MLGISVLVVALFCFVGSLLWSKLDESSGGRQVEQGAPVIEETPLPLPARSQLLNRLIANQIPLIEEEASLPKQLSFHGEVVGRRRLRIDVRHEITGPHYSATTAAEGEDTAQATDNQVSASSTYRIDTASSHSSLTSAEAPRPKPDKKHGLLERVLVAMEREKRR